MHVVIFSEHFHKNPSGPRNAATHIARGLRKLGVEVTVLNLAPRNYLEPIEGVGDVIHRRYGWRLVPTRYGRHRYFARQLHRLHRDKPIDCVISMGIWSGGAAALFRERTGVPYVLNPRSRLSHKPGDWKYDFADGVVRGCDAFVGVTDVEVQGWCQALGITRDARHFGVHNGFNQSAMEGDAEPVPGIPPGQPIVLCMANLRRAKGQHRLMQALDMMGDADWFAVFAGEGREHQAAWVRERHAERKLKDRMLLAGEVTGARWRWLYRNATIFALTPVYPEAFANVFLEAQASGLPVLTSNCGANSEVLGEGAAIVVERGDNMDAEVAAALRRLLSDPELRKRMGDAGRAHAAAFSWDDTARGYLKAVEYAIASRRG